jgi:osmotically-inducible protein OsmY
MSNDAHSIESRVRRELVANPGFSVSSLVVRRIPNGVCLEGVVQVHDDTADVDSVVRQVLGVKEVQNHLLVCSGGG